MAEPAAMFVPPDFAVLMEPESAPAVTLISARGATGKSALAAHLSHRLQVPLWSLQRDSNVSADALGGRLTAYTEAVDGLQAFKSAAGAFILVDSLDEARVRVSASSWREFVDGLLSAASPATNRFVLLGRERVLSDLTMYLIDADLPFAWFEVSHFDAAQQRSYLDNRYRVAGKALPNPAYESARDSVLRALAGAVPPAEVDVFVGYAPVLDAVGELLARGNLQAIDNEFSDAGGSGGQMAVLSKVVQSLLDREQAKLAESIEDLGAPVIDAGLYGDAEQLQWLTHTHWGSPPPALERCPAESRAAYAERAQLQATDHPFGGGRDWTSSVFAAYTAARAFDSSAARNHLWEIGRATDLLIQFLAHFRGDALGFVDEWQFAALHASLLAGESHSIEAFVSLEVAGAETSDEALDGEFIAISEEGTRRVTTFEVVVETAGAFVVRGPTAFLDLTYRGRVLVAPHAESLTLGPELYIECDTLEFSRDSVEVIRTGRLANGGLEPDEPSVALVVHSEFRPPAVLVSSVPTDVLEVRLSPPITMAYPWFQYCREIEPAGAAQNERAERFLRMLMRLARRHGKKEFAVFDKKLEGRQGVKGVEFRRVVGALQAMGVVEFQAPMVALTAPYVAERFDGKDRPGLPRLIDKMDVWGPVLQAIEGALTPNS